MIFCQLIRLLEQVILVDRVKLQYSIICKRDEKNNFIDLIHGFSPGNSSFFITNKWIWDDNNCEDGFYQETEVLKNGETIALSKSNIFNVRLSHSHHNLFKDIPFQDSNDYRIRVGLFNKEDEKIEEASLDYPLYVK